MSETEGIVLSPQRRSFTTGCQMNKDPPKDADNPSGNSSNTASKSSSQDRGERGSEKVISRAPSPKLSYRHEILTSELKREKLFRFSPISIGNVGKTE